MANIKEIIVPQLGESVTEATIATWYKKAGDAVAADELLVELETDKVTLEVNAPASGKLTEVKAEEGDTVEVGNLIGLIEEGAVADTKPAAVKEEPQSAPAKPATNNNNKSEELSPAPRKIIADNNLDSKQISGTGKDGRITKGDVLNLSLIHI